MPVAEKGWRQTARRGKREAVLKDPESTGRKRAAKLYPLDKAELCEWSHEILKADWELTEGKEAEFTRADEESMLMYYSGSKEPFQNCKRSTQAARHHGPDKNTLNNEPGNVHRICHTCHNLWHVGNDPDYDWNNPGNLISD